MNGILISIGGLHTGCLGSFGSAWFETPQLDRLAARCMAFDQCFTDDPTPWGSRSGWLTGLHSAPGGSRPGDLCRLPGALRSTGIRTTLIRDTRGLLGPDLPEACSFDETVEVERVPRQRSHTVFSAAADWLRQRKSDDPFLLVLDSHGIHPPWDDEDPTIPAPPLATPGQGNTSSSEDPADEGAREVPAVGLARALAGLDEQLEALLDHLDQSAGWEETMVLLTSDCGQGIVHRTDRGVGRPFLHEELMHLPLLLHLPGLTEPGQRSHAMVQLQDICPTVLQALGAPVPPGLDGLSLMPVMAWESLGLREFVAATVRGQEWAFRTADWHLILPQGDTRQAGAAEPRLYAKPEDRWERNDVYKMHPEAARDLEERLRAWMAGA